MASPGRIHPTEPGSTAPAAAQFPELPEEVLICILQHVPQQQRLTSCALACQSWAAAAAAVPVDIQVKSSEDCQQVQHWLAKQGGSLGGLKANGPTPEYIMGTLSPLQLHMPKLTRLHSIDIRMLRLQHNVSRVSTRSSTRKSMSSPLTGHDSRSNSSLVRSHSSAGAGAGASAGVGASAVLPQLWELRLSFCRVTQHLASELLGATTLSALQWDNVTCTSNWTSTRKLSESIYSMLSSLIGLQELHLEVGSWDRTSAAGANRLLAALQRLTQLRRLHLRACGLQKAVHQPQPEQQGASYQCYAALTASTNLTSLYVREEFDMPVPQAAFDHMLPTGRVLPNLRELTLVGRYPGNYLCVDAAQVARIAVSCPALQQLRLLNVTPKGFDVSCLSQLPPAVTQVEGLEWRRPAA